jgi:uncharacterized protein (DUF2147 family)
MPSTATIIAAVVVILIVLIVAAYYQAKAKPPGAPDPILGNWTWKSGTAPLTISSDLKVHNSATPATWPVFTKVSDLKYTYGVPGGDQYAMTLSADFNTLNWVRDKDKMVGSWTRAA